MEFYARAKIIRDKAVSCVRRVRWYIFCTDTVRGTLALTVPLSVRV